MVETSERGYRWGRFQGWSALVFGVLVYLITPFTSGPVGKFDLYLTGALHIITGIGLLGKKRYGFVLLYVLAARTALAALVGGPHHAVPDILIQWTLFLWWALPALWYYPKRYREFGFRKKAQAVQPERLPMDYLKPMRDLTDEEREEILGHIRGRTDKN
jgi:hypothetical protein